MNFFAANKDFFSSVGVTATVLGGFLALLWAVFQLLSGSASHSLAVELECSRSPTGDDNDEDFVALKMRLKKGPIGRIRITDVRIVTAIEPVSDKGPLENGYNRSCTDAIKRAMLEGGLDKDGVIQKPRDGELAYLVPNDAGDYACHTTVSRNDVIRWEVSLVGVRMLGSSPYPLKRFAQWTASAVSLPNRASGAGAALGTAQNTKAPPGGGASEAGGGEKRA